MKALITTISICLCLSPHAQEGVSNKVCNVQEENKFPKHWGEQPRIQTKDRRKLPTPFKGYGSSTLVKWILENQKKDKKTK